MSDRQFELLEDRLTPALVNMPGSEGMDLYYIIGQGDAASAVSVFINGQLNLAAIPLGNASNIFWFEGKGGNDAIYHNSSASLFANMGSGDDAVIVDGAEGGPAQIVGGAGNDIFIGGQASDYFYGDSGNDLLIGGGGRDTIDGAGDEDLVITDFLSNSLNHLDLAAIWQNTNVSRPDRVVNALRAVTTVDDGQDDSVSSAMGFDLVYESTQRRFQVGSNVYGVTWHVSNTTELLARLAVSVPGDIIELAAGEYNLTSNLWGSFPGRTIRGAGMGETILRGGSFRLENMGSTNPTLIQNMTLDLTGQFASSGYQTFAGGVFYLDGVEVTGQGQSDTAAVLFRKNASGPTNAIVVNSYFHDTRGDLVSTNGNSGNIQEAATSWVELYDNVGHTPGPNSQDQVLSAHFGFRLVDIAGTYWDAAENVVAPDNNSRIDLYLTTITPGARSGNVTLTTTSSVIDGANITASRIQSGGLVQNSTLINISSVGSAFIRPENAGSIVKNNRIVQTQASTSKKGVLSTASNVQLIDNVFENWNGEEWQLLGSGSVAVGNIII